MIHMKKPTSSLQKYISDRFFTKLNLPLRPMSDAECVQMSEEMMTDYVDELELGNRMKTTPGGNYRIPDDIPNYMVARLALYAYDIRFINTGGDGDYDIPAFYVLEDGPDHGIYSTSKTYIKRCLQRFSATLTESQIKDILQLLEGMAEHVGRCEDKNLIPVNNGIFNYKTKELLPFSPDYVFLTKTKIDYVDNPQNPIIHNPDDNTDWDVETWISELSDDPEIVELLWQVIGSVVRPEEAWDKVIFLYSTIGNNGKGTLCRLLRNLCGDGAHMSLPISDFGKDFRLENLLNASAIITDENDVGDYIDKASNFKAVVTHDLVNINRKNEKAIMYRYNGIMIQCINELPRFRDKSDSLYRRILAIPFEKCFTGQERKYIKNDYLNRPEVLEYVLHKVLHMDYHEFSEPAACKHLMSEYKTDNDTIRQFVDEMLPQCAWDLLPFTFLYDLYVAWMKRFYPAVKPLGRNNFINDLLRVLSENPDWDCQDKGKEYLSKNRGMDQPEYLIEKYGLEKWYNESYQGPSKAKRCTIRPSAKYRGIVRVVPRVITLPGAASGNDDEDAETDAPDNGATA